MRGVILWLRSRMQLVVGFSVEAARVSRAD